MGTNSEGIDLQKLEKASGCSTIKHLYVDLTGDLVSGMILTQLSFWFAPGKGGKTKLRVHKHGRYWLARLRTEWAAECRISPKQFDRAIKLLESMGLIQTRLMLFDGKTMPHVWLDVPALTNAVVSVLTKGQNPFGPKVETQIAETSKPITDTYTDQTTDGEPAADAASATVVYLYPAQACKEPDVKASEILKAHALKQDLKTCTNPFGLAVLWKQTLADVSGKYVQELTGKDRALLKQVIAEAKEQAGPLVKYVIPHWDKFAARVKVEKSLDKVPDKPSVMFFRLHWACALQLIANASKSAQPVAVPVISVSTPEKPAKVAQSVVLSALQELEEMDKAQQK